MLEITANAKINLFLEITGKLPNGYHTVDTVMQSVSLSDTLIIELLPSNEGIVISSDDSNIPTDERNIAYKAAARFLEFCGLKCGVSIILKKRIPCEAGLGGGSADAAAVLVGMNKACGDLLNDDTLITLAASVGADVPFCIKGGTQKLKGIGTEMVDKRDTPALSLVIAKPASGISTPEAYKYLDKVHNHFCKYNPLESSRLWHAIREGNASDISCAMFNRFEEASVGLCPESNALISFMRDNSYGALLSGSGAAVFAVMDNENQAQMLMKKIKVRYPSYFVTVAKTEAHGCVINE